MFPALHVEKIATSIEKATFDFCREINGAPAKKIARAPIGWCRLALQITYLAWRPGCACKSLTNKRATAHSAALHGASANADLLE